MLAGDTNDLKLDNIVNLSANMKSLVHKPTRLNPDKILDNIISDMSKWYQSPVCLPPLAADPGTGGQPSDHLTVIMRPISAFNNNPARTKREILVRPMKQSGIDMFGNWVTQQNWEEVLEAENVDKKSEILQNILMEKIDEYLPHKKRIISSDDQPYCTDKMKTLKRQKTREYRKHRTSTKYKELNIQCQKEISAAKNSY